MTITLRLNNHDARVLKKYAAHRGMTLSDYAALSMREQMEDEIDRKAYQDAMAEFKKNPVTYTLSDVEKELGLL